MRTVTRSSLTTQRRAAAVRCCKQQCWFNPGPISYQRQAPVLAIKARIQTQLYTCTLCSQLSLDRWSRWAQQADSWGGPLSVALYVPAPPNSPAAQAYLTLAVQLAESYAYNHPEQPFMLSALYANHYAREGVTVLQHVPGITARQHPLLDPNTAHTPSYDHLYPINALRNLAIAQAATPLVLCADGDFIFSQGLQDCISSVEVQQVLMPDAAQQQQQQNKPVMLVLPAFQLALGDALPDSQAAIVPRTKAALAQALASGAVEPFHCGAFPPDLQPIELAAWLAAEAMYTVPYCEYFEPQGLAVKQQLPQYDEAFRGYGLNKVQHAWHMSKLGYTFKVFPDAFMVTVPHKRSGSWRPLPGTAADEAHLNRIKLVYQQFKTRLAEQLSAAGHV